MIPSSRTFQNRADGFQALVETILLEYSPEPSKTLLFENANRWANWFSLRPYKGNPSKNQPQSAGSLLF